MFGRMRGKLASLSCSNTPACLCVKKPCDFFYGGDPRVFFLWGVLLSIIFSHWRRVWIFVGNLLPAGRGSCVFFVFRDSHFFFLSCFLLFYFVLDSVVVWIFLYSCVVRRIYEGVLMLHCISRLRVLCFLLEGAGRREYRMRVLQIFLIWMVSECFVTKLLKIMIMHLQLILNGTKFIANAIFIKSSSLNTKSKKTTTLFW